MCRVPHSLIALFLALQLAACGGASNEGLLRLEPGPDPMVASPLVTGDPDGPIPEPTLPPGLAAAAAKQAAASTPPEPDLPVFAEKADGEKRKEPKEDAARAGENRLSYRLIVQSPDAPELVDPFTKACLLEELVDTPPKTVTGLDQRMRSDLETAQEVLRSFGYYSGTAHGVIRRVRRDADASNGDAGDGPWRAYTVTITFAPGPQYTVGYSPVVPVDKKLLAPYADRDARAKTDAQTGDGGVKLRLARQAPPGDLAEAGLPQGAPALADSMLDAVSEARELFRDRGYPFAKTASTKYTLDTAKHTLHGEVLMDSGRLAYMGPLVVKGEESVSRRYLEALQTWREGRAWNQRLIENFRDSLRQSGLFSAADIYPASEDNAEGLRPVVAELTAAPERTVGGALKYDTDFGPGVQAYWEHRNLTGNGDRLRIEMPVWRDLQELAASYRLPFLWRKDQDFIAQAAFHHEDTDAYEWTAAIASAGIERRFSRRWLGSLSAMGEGGELKDPDEPRRSYYYIGLPGTLVYDGANSLLDATKGVRLNLAASPYTGEYNKDFTVVRARAEGEAYLPVAGEDTLVMAFRAMYGMVTADAPDVPASLRYYVGGGGSVRGYEYQSLGPRNASRDPLGGGSAVELSSEARLRFNETWGAVVFLDGGMAYNDQIPDFAEEELRWGAGVGLRFFTAIGPIRLDVATPLNPRRKDSSVQVYFSIGQSF